MIHHLAQLTTDMLGPIVPWIVGASGLMFFANQVITFWKEHLRERPVPAETYATKIELEKLEGEVRDFFREMRDTLASEVKEQAGKRKKLYETIEAVARDMASMKSDQAASQRQLYGLDSKIDRILLDRSSRK